MPGDRDGAPDGLPRLEVGPQRLEIQVSGGGLRLGVRRTGAVQLKGGRGGGRLRADAAHPAQAGGPAHLHADAPRFPDLAARLCPTRRLGAHQRPYRQQLLLQAAQHPRPGQNDRPHRAEPHSPQRRETPTKPALQAAKPPLRHVTSHSRRLRKRKKPAHPVDAGVKIRSFKSKNATAQKSRQRRGLERAAGRWLGGNRCRHGMTGECPVDRFERDHRSVLKPLASRPYRLPLPPSASACRDR